ncbi:hypothetical protein COCNU_14G009590 [Cocos nucifera]|uniref:Methyltransferase n=1 Tax=Cocos nucifera TaxID=13894 RepID=A0A8K0IVK6_COCNU|nr:hypothetical protein COCNU_14G009590 [Cocos nucifera]
MAGVRLGRSAKRAPLGFCAKVALVMLLGLAFIVIWSIFSSPSSTAISSQRSSFDDIFDPDASPAVGKKEVDKSKKRNRSSPPKDRSGNGNGRDSGSPEKKKKKKEGGIEEKAAAVAKETGEAEGQQEEEREGAEDMAEVEGLEEVVEGEEGMDEDMEDGVDVNPDEEDEEKSRGNKKKKNKKKKKLGPLFDPGARYNWKLCGGRHGHNYIPCVDMEGGHRHHERSCPRMPLMCLVSLPQEYRPPPPWPKRESKIFYKNVAHPKLSAFIKTHSWLNLSEEYLLFPRQESEFKSGAQHYINSIEEVMYHVIIHSSMCKQPVVIVVEMDRILRPEGWAIIRDKSEILNPLETILKSLHWEIRMTYAKDKEGKRLGLLVLDVHSYVDTKKFLEAFDSGITLKHTLWRVHLRDCNIKESCLLEWLE